MVLSQTEDKAQDKQKIQHINNIEENSGLAFCFSEEKGERKEGRILYFELCSPF